MIKLPDEFDLGIYRALNADLHHLSDDDLTAHFIYYGRSEGRRANQISLREDFAALALQHEKVLEIGPFANPILNGLHVDYADYLSYEELIVRAKLLGLDEKKVPPIKYVLKDNGLNNINESYDAVLSCHCIEHQPDLISHLKQTQRILRKKSGRYYLLVPDKRYCFDRFQSESTIADVIEAHEVKREFHSLKSVIEHRALITHNYGAVHWDFPQKKPIINSDLIKLAISEWHKNKNNYIDVHAWYFTPDSFEEIISILNEMDYIHMKLEKIYATRHGSFEFWAVLSVS